MNQRIKLPPQDWLGYDPERGDIHGYTFEQMREFAQLIIKECLEQVRDEVQYEHDWKLADAVVKRVSGHFGVEE